MKKSTSRPSQTVLHLVSTQRMQCKHHNGVALACPIHHSTGCPCGVQSNGLVGYDKQPEMEWVSKKMRLRDTGHSIPVVTSKQETTKDKPRNEPHV